MTDISTHSIAIDRTFTTLTSERFSTIAMRCENIKLHNQIHALFSGHPVNYTENRPALHTKLRDLTKPSKEVTNALATCQQIADWARSNHITDIVHVGIGGSYWGPYCLHEAFSHLPSHYKLHFLGTIDPMERAHILSQVNPDSTLFIFASKSFTTVELLNNLKAIKAKKEYCYAVTANQQQAIDCGFLPENIVPIWDWVGGRFSCWSAVSLSIMLTYGFEVFHELLRGAYDIDQHFLNAPWEDNLPVNLAIADYYYAVEKGYKSKAIIPYPYALRGLVPHLQQLHMESLGKPSTQPTGVVVWGELGCHAQHTFNQLLHQGNQVIPVDFIMSKDTADACPEMMDFCRAQQHALYYGHHEGDPLKQLPGNRPSQLIMLDSLSPYAIGNLLAAYEHKVTTLGWLMGINPFDQFGVEYSKLLANRNAELLAL